MISLGALKPRFLFDKRCTVRFFKKISYTKFSGHKTQILTNHQEDQTLKSKILTRNEAYSLLARPPTGRPVPWAPNPREVTLACVTVTSHDSDVLSSWTRQQPWNTKKEPCSWSVATELRPVIITLHHPASSRRAQRNDAASLFPFCQRRYTRPDLLKKLPLSQSLLFRCLLRRWSCGHNNSGNCFRGARSCALLEMGCWDSLDAHLLTKRGGQSVDCKWAHQLKK